MKTAGKGQRLRQIENHWRGLDHEVNVSQINFLSMKPVNNRFSNKSFPRCFLTSVSKQAFVQKH